MSQFPAITLQRNMESHVQRIRASQLRHLYYNSKSISLQLSQLMSHTFIAFPMGFSVTGLHLKTYYVDLTYIINYFYGTLSASHNC